MSKDVIIAGAIAVGCIALIAVAFIAPKSKSTESDAPKTDVTTTVTEPSLNGPSSTFGPTPGLDPNTSFNSNPSGASGLPPAGGGALPPANTFPSGPGGFPPVASAPQSSTSPAFNFNSNLPAPAPTTVETPAPATEAKTHTVASGELLGDIALKYYGSSKAWKKIQEANPGVDPKNLKVGQKLVIPAADPKVGETAPATVATGAGERSYTVKAGDTLYVIAKKELGSASRWKEIEKLNNLSSSELRVGQAIKLPTSATDTAPATGGKGTTDTAPAAGGKTHTVAKGETLGDISKKYFGTTKNWKKIVDANPGVSPENLKVGEKLVIPEIAGSATAPAGAPVDSAAAPAAAGEYTIKAGDTLGSIALKELGSKNKWKEIQDANPGLDPHNLRAGQKIKVPGKAADKAPVAAPAALPGAAPKPAANGGFGTTAPAPGFGPGAAPTFGAPAGGQQATAFPTDSSFSSPYGGSGFGQPSQPFGQTGPGFSQTGVPPAAEPFPGSQPAPFGGPGAGFPPAGTTDQPLR